MKSIFHDTTGKATNCVAELDLKMRESAETVSGTLQCKKNLYTAAWKWYMNLHVFFYISQGTMVQKALFFVILRHIIIIWAFLWLLSKKQLKSLLQIVYRIIRAKNTYTWNYWNPVENENDYGITKIHFQKNPKTDSEKADKTDKQVWGIFAIIGKWHWNGPGFIVSKVQHSNRHRAINGYEQTAPMTCAHHAANSFIY